ncbi:MAG: hypothetical protein HWD92_11125 [Flavobacteriia bacterium]|nr:hypothetical protein [Flavobacteriia bacterium]
MDIVSLSLLIFLILYLVVWAINIHSIFKSKYLSGLAMGIWMIIVTLIPFLGLLFYNLYDLYVPKKVRRKEQNEELLDDI